MGKAKKEKKAIKESGWNGGLCNKGGCEVLLLLHTAEGLRAT
jgi:hypothetical protein